MTRQEFMDQQKGDALAYAQNLASQCDDALARIAAFDAKYAALQTQLTTAQSLIDAMGGTALGRQLAHDKKRAEILKRKADADAASTAASADLAALDTPVIGP